MSRPAAQDNTKQSPSPADDGDTPFKVQKPATTFVDVTDLLFYLRNHTTLTGIQRVQCEIVRHLPGLDAAKAFRFVTLDGSCNPYVLEISALLDVIAYMDSTPVKRTELDRRLDVLLSRATAASIRQGDRFLSIGSFWGVRGGSLFLQKLKNSGVIIGLYIHDILNITHPEYFRVLETNKYVKGFVGATNYANFILTTSQYNKASLTKHLEARGLALPVTVVPLGHALGIADATADISNFISEMANSEFVLCVGTIEVRKNPGFLFNIWKMMVQAGRKDIPKLVLAGRRGWLVQDFIEQVEACGYLGGKIVFLHDATDGELALLYRKCLLTMFPSFVEGWGLPVGESIIHGKICIASSAGGIPEVAGDVVDYVDPYNASDGLKVLCQYLDDPDLRRRREREIADRFKPRSWRDAASDFVNCVEAQASEIEPFQGVAAVKLPPNRALPIISGSTALPANALEGDLSADLICISGWSLPETGGALAQQPTATIRFRADAPPGTAINLIMRLRAANANARRAKVSSGSGAVTDVSLNNATDSLAVLSCEVEPDNLVSATITFEGEMDHDGGPYGGLRGILYFLTPAEGNQAGKRIAAEQIFSQAGPPPGPIAPSRADPDGRPGSRRQLPGVHGVLGDSRRAASLDEFLHSSNSSWPSRVTGYRDAPIFANQLDMQTFYKATETAVGPTTDQIFLVRRSDQYVSTLRFSEGSIFDLSRVSRGFGYLQKSPVHGWLSADEEGPWMSEQAIAAAPRYDKSCLVFYNGNLHNYYHWTVEGLLPLSILSQAFGPDQNLHIALPRSRFVNAVFDHRETLRAVGLDGYDITEIAVDLIKVREAVWVESEVIQSMPALYLKAFQKKVSAIHAGSRLRKKRRLLVARKGPTRMIHNLRQVSAFCFRHGFETVYLEGMSVVDQIVLFQNAEFIVGAHGAGLANLLYCDPGTKVIELMPSAELRPFFWLISEKLGLVHGMLFCGGARGTGFQASVNVDVDKLEALYRMVDAHF